MLFHTFILPQQGTEATVFSRLGFSFLRTVLLQPHRYAEMQYITLYSSYSWPGFPGGRTKLFLIGADYAGYKKAKRTR